MTLFRLQQWPPITQQSRTVVRGMEFLARLRSETRGESRERDADLGFENTKGLEKERAKSHAATPPPYVDVGEATNPLSIGRRGVKRAETAILAERFLSVSRRASSSRLLRLPRSRSLTGSCDR